MRVILINVSAVEEALYAARAEKDLPARDGREGTAINQKASVIVDVHREQARSYKGGGGVSWGDINRRHKKPRSLDQGLCYRLEVNQWFSS